MRIVPIMICASLASACFATEELKIGALAGEEQDLPDAGPVEEDGSVEPTELDAATPAQDAALSAAGDASARPRTDDDGEELDAGEREEIRASTSDAALDAGRVADAAADADDSVIDANSADSGPGEAGSDARSLLCALEPSEPWHCP